MKDGPAVLAMVAVMPVLSIGIVASSATENQIIRIRGCHSITGPADFWSKAFMQAKPGISIVVLGGDTDAGFNALFPSVASRECGIGFVGIVCSRGCRNRPRCLMLVCSK